MNHASFSGIKPGRTAHNTAKPGFVTRLISSCAAAWRLSPTMILLILIAPFVFAFASAGVAFLGKEPYKLLTQEDGIAETMQVFFYLITLILGIIVMRRRQQAGHKFVAFLYLGLCFGLGFLIGEELSWGQRIFGWTTAEGFAEINKQGETNLHNVYGVGDTFKWVQLLVGAYGVLLPLITLGWQGPKALRTLLPSVTPHYLLMPYFGAMFLWRLYRNVVPEPTQFYFVISEYNEVVEAILAMGLLLFMVFQIRRNQTQDELMH